MKLHNFVVLDDATNEAIAAHEIRIMVDGSKRGITICCRRTDGEIAIYADDRLSILPRSGNLVYVRNVKD